jgi:hypothetical protein
MEVNIMGIKSITSLALTAAAVACISVVPAQADNNKYLNQMAMQMYVQNQAANYNPYNSPYANGNYGYGTAYNGQTPWSAGAMPYGYTNGNSFRYGNAYGNAYGHFRAPRVSYHHHRWLH